MWLKETHVVIFITHESQHFMQWWQRCHELYHGLLWTCCHKHIVRGGYP
jgi:hypothetical protein